MSSDAKTLYDLCVVAMTGNVTSVTTNEIGELCAARWITLASRILRLYITEASTPDRQLKLNKLSLYVVSVYYKATMMCA